MLLFVAAFFFTFLVAEPYPSLTMPGFARVYHVQDSIFSFEESTVLVQWNSGSTSRLDQHDLLSTVRLTGATAVMKNIFSSNHYRRTSVDTSSTSAIQRLKRLRLSAQEWLMANRTRRVRYSEPTTAAWLATRIQTLYPDSIKAGRIPVSASVLWHQREFVRRNKGLHMVSERQTDSVCVVLTTKGSQP